MEDGAFHAILRAVAALNKSTLQFSHHAKSNQANHELSRKTGSQHQLCEQHVNLLNQTAAPCVVPWAGMQVLSVKPYTVHAYVLACCKVEHANRSCKYVGVKGPACQERKCFSTVTEWSPGGVGAQSRVAVLRKTAGYTHMLWCILSQFADILSDAGACRVNMPNAATPVPTSVSTDRPCQNEYSTYGSSCAPSAPWRWNRSVQQPLLLPAQAPGKLRSKHRRPMNTRLAHPSRLVRLRRPHRGRYAKL